MASVVLGRQVPSISDTLRVVLDSIVFGCERASMRRDRAGLPAARLNAASAVITVDADRR
jgi:hypothetical protein